MSYEKFGAFQSLSQNSDVAMSQMSLAHSHKIAELHKAAQERIYELELLVSDLKRQLADIEQSKSKLIDELSDSRVLCRLAHDKIVEISQVQERQKQKIGEMLAINKQLKAENTDFKWKIELMNKRESAETKNGESECFCAKLKEICGEIPESLVTEALSRALQQNFVESSTLTENQLVDAAVYCSLSSELERSLPPIKARAKRSRKMPSTDSAS